MSGEPAVLALRRFEGYYQQLDAAIEAQDVDAITRLVEERAPVIEQLAASYRGEALPEAVRERLVHSEETLRARLTAMHAELATALAAQRQRGTAIHRYTRGG